MPAMFDRIKCRDEAPRAADIARLLKDIEGLDIDHTELIHSYVHVGDNTVEFATIDEHVERDYVLKLLHQRGGRALHHDGASRPIVLPAYVHKTWPEQPAWRRAGFYLRRKVRQSWILTMIAMPVYMVWAVCFYTIILAHSFSKRFAA